MIDSVYSKELSQLASVLFIQLAGIEVGSIIKERYIPSHHILMTAFNVEAFNYIEVERDILLQFLKKDSIDINAINGWHIIRYKNRNFGWIKKIDNRTNNYYPNAYKLRGVADYI